MRSGWQHEASARVEERFREDLFTRMPEQVQAVVRSQAGVGAAAALTVAPTNRDHDSPPPLPHDPLAVVSDRLSPCLCATTDVAVHLTLWPSSCRLWRVAARTCREAGGRVHQHAGEGHGPGCADGLPLQGGAQLAVDTTLICALHADGRPRLGAAKHDGVALKVARRKKSTVYPEVVGPHSRTKLVVLAAEVGGRWSEETRVFLSQLASARAMSDLPLTRRRAEQAWRLRWGDMWTRAVAKAVASSLLDLRDSHGGDGKTPTTHEVVSDHRHAGLRE